MKRAAVLLVLIGCGTEDGTRVKMDPARAEFYDAPFPSDDLVVDGRVDLSGFPNRGHAVLVDQAREMAAAQGGFATTGGVFFSLTAPIDPDGLPTLAGSVEDGASVFLLSLDDGARVPVDVTFREDGGPYGAENMIALVPLQGAPLRPSMRHAAIVTTALVDLDGASLARGRLDGALRDELDALGVDTDAIAGVTVFTTGDPAREMRDAIAATAGERIAFTDLALTDTFTDFCVYATTVDIPDFQSGTPPFSSEGGAWEFDGDTLLHRHTEEARAVITLPATAPPPGGFPVVVFSRTGAGGDRPLVDRGQELQHGGPPLEPGEGPARYFARAGFAAVQVDGPLGGLRNPNGADEQFLTFNVNNLYAMRDNVRESALELAIVAASLDDVSIDASACGGGTATFDTDHVAIMGHSMGAWIAPLAAAFQPRFGALVLSGAGGSWIANVLYKKEPLEVLPFILILVQARRDLAPALFNGGGSGSLPSSLADDSLTEVTAGSGFLCSHLFDRYADITFRPAAFFALQVVRRPGPGLVTCHGGGFVASGAAGADRLPQPAFPDGLELLPLEGAGEVQTPLRVPPGLDLALGDPVFFRHAKAGELAEHVTEYLLVRGDRIEDRAATYRGLGRCYLG